MEWYAPPKNRALFISRPGVYPRDGVTAWKVEIHVAGTRVYVGRRLTHADAVKLHQAALRVVPRLQPVDPTKPAWRRLFRGHAEAESRK